jgi:hypothetical protein
MWAGCVCEPERIVTADRAPLRYGSGVGLFVGSCWQNGRRIALLIRRTKKAQSK